MRHGETFHNVLHNDEPDTLLTPRGVAQARSWSAASAADTDPGHGPAFLSAAEIVLVSPLRRTLQTACYAFAATEVGEKGRTVGNETLVS
jgi:broad specificity phosphatase PhoE